MFGNRGPQKRSVEAGPRLQEIDQRQSRPKSELEGNVAELDIEIHQARAAAKLRLMCREPDRKLAGKCRCAAAAHAFDQGHKLGAARRDRSLSSCPTIGNRSDRSFEIFNIER